MSEMYNFCNYLIKKYKLFWQYPVISEKTVFEQQKNNNNYIGLPWATIIDKRINIQLLLLELKNKLDKNNNYITFCQHISFRKLIPILKILNIKTYYSPHKIKSENKIGNIKIISTPLYAVNIEDNNRNELFRDKDYIKINRDIYYSFIGGYNPSCYLTDIRKRIIIMKHPKTSLVKYTGHWHFDNLVYKHQVRNKNLTNNEKNIEKNNTIFYNKVLLRSRYSLCPSGSGPNSIRFWESLAVGSIPILLSDTLDLPKHKLWNNAIIIIKEKDVQQLNNILSKINKEKEEEMKKNCIKIYNDLKNNFLQIYNE